MSVIRTKLKTFCLLGLKAGGILSACLALGYGLLPKPDLLPPDLEYSRTVLDRDGEVIFLTTTSDGMLRLPTTMDQLAPELLEATLEMEDRRFFSHPGADMRSLLRAAWGLVSRQKLGGGSTITMQLSRLR
jgi:penicillin-binding protein 1C